MSTNAISVFISYSHKDETLREQLMPFLEPLKQGSLISDWHDRKISAGASWDEEIDARLNSADLIVMLLSQDFLASEYITKTEVPAALARHRAGEAVVIPVILRTFTWFSSPLADLQSVPRDKKAITTWNDRDAAFVVVSDAIRQAAEGILMQRKVKTERLSAATRQYRSKVDEMLSDGLISLVERETLDELRDELALTEDAALAIEAEAKLPFRQYHDGLEKYRKTILKVLAHENPISASTRRDLELRKRDLGLKDDDVAKLEEQVLADLRRRSQESDKSASTGIQTQASRPADVEVSAAQPGPSSTITAAPSVVVKGLDAALASLLDSDSDTDRVRICADDAAGDSWWLVECRLSESTNDVVAVTALRSDLSSLGLPKPFWGRIDQAAASGEQTLGQCESLDVRTLRAALAQLLVQVFGVAVSPMAMWARAMDTGEDDDAADEDGSGEADGECKEETAGGGAVLDDEDFQQILREAIEAFIANEADEPVLEVWAEDDTESHIVLTLSVDDEDDVRIDISGRKSLPSDLRPVSDQWQLLDDELDFTPSEDGFGGRMQWLYARKELAIDDVVELINDVLDKVHGLPNGQYRLGCGESNTGA
ncbi:MAG: hypothetical protein RLY71_4139 [Pseudomonadota bacterium]|jgi:hypothetical protein